MKFKVKNILRGAGLVYFNVSIDGNANSKSLHFEAKMDNRQNIPCIVHNVEKWKELADFVLVVPLFEFRSVEISCKECENKQEFSAFRIKWLSRWNYKASPKIANVMRDFEKRPWANNTRFHFQLIMNVPSRSIMLMKAYVNFPSHAANSKLHVLDSQGNEIEDVDIQIGEFNEIEQMKLKRREFPFTLRMPIGKEFCLYAETSDDSHDAVVYFNHDVMDLYKRKYPSLWEDCMSSDRYQDLVYAREFLFKTDVTTEYCNQVGPKLSIVVPIIEISPNFLSEMIESVKAQFYKNWELVLVASVADIEALTSAIYDLKDERVRVIEARESGDFATYTNLGIEAASGDFVGFMNSVDKIDPRCLSLISERINESSNIDVLYTDHDLVNADGNFHSPAFKPSLNIDYLRAYNYISNFLVVRSELAKKIKLDSSLEGFQDYDFILKLTELTNKFEHVQEVLYHRRQAGNEDAFMMEDKDCANSAAIEVLKNHLSRSGIDADVEPTQYRGLFNPIYCVSGNPKVSIIIPNHNHADILKNCISSIIQKTKYDNYEVIIVENGSDEPSIFEYYNEVTSVNSNVKLVNWHEPFNFSKVCNFGAKHASGDFLLFMNNDTEVLEEKWLDYMVGDCQRKDVGIVGAKLIYLDDTVQHAGVYFSDDFDPSRIDGPLHLFLDFDKDAPGYSYRNILKSNVEAVTGACLMTKTEIFNRVDGLDEDYTIDYSDIDYCFKVSEAGYKILMDPSIVLRHYESASLGVRITSMTERFMAEQDRLRTKWAKRFIEGDKLSSCIIRPNSHC